MTASRGRPSRVAAEWVRTRERERDADGATALVMGGNGGPLEEALAGTGAETTGWSRFKERGRPCSAWPPEGRFREVWVRMPPSGLEAEMLLHAAVARARDGGAVFLYGANRDGVRSAAKRFPAGAGAPRTLLAKGGCRVLAATRTGPPPRPDGLEPWACETTLDWGAGERRWRHYPGVFAFGRLDGGTALLAEHLPRLGPGARLLDYGAGTGIVAAAALDRAGEDASADLLDHDAIALAAATHNLPRVHAILARGPRAARGPYDLIASNPPIRESREHSTRVIEELVSRAPSLLRREGRLVLVAQRRIGAGRLLGRAFRSVGAVADRGPFRVWSAAGRRSAPPPSSPQP